jgi:hypothetical protein
MNKPRKTTKPPALPDLNDPAWLAAEIRRIDLKAFHTACALLDLAADVLCVADTATQAESRPTGRALELIHAARKELRHVEHERRLAPLK